MGWAFQLTQDVPLADSDSLRKSRARFTGFPNALKPPFVARGDTHSAGTFWHGSKMDEWANAWTRYYTGGKGNYMVAAHGRLGNDAGADVSEPGWPGRSAAGAGAAHGQQLRPRSCRACPLAESLKEMVSGNYSAYMPALEAAQIVGDKVVRDLVEHWASARIDNSSRAVVGRLCPQRR